MSVGSCVGASVGSGSAQVMVRHALWAYGGSRVSAWSEMVCGVEREKVRGFPASTESPEQSVVKKTRIVASLPVLPTTAVFTGTVREEGWPFSVRTGAATPTNSSLVTGVADSEPTSAGVRISAPGSTSNASARRIRTRMADPFRSRCAAGRAALVRVIVATPEGDGGGLRRAWNAL